MQLCQPKLRKLLPMIGTAALRCWLRYVQVQNFFRVKDYSLLSCMRFVPKSKPWVSDQLKRRVRVRYYRHGCNLWSHFQSVKCWSTCCLPDAVNLFLGQLSQRGSNVRIGLYHTSRRSRSNLITVVLFLSVRRGQSQTAVGYCRIWCKFWQVCDWLCPSSQYDSGMGA